MRQKLCNLALFAGGVALSSALWAASATPEVLSYTCNGCHGTGGNSAGLSNPSIAGVPAKYFENAMKEFKSGTRPSTIMGRLAKGYSDEEVKLMADYFAAQKIVRTKQAVDAKKVAQGKKLHQKNCEMCHQKDGRQSGAGGVLAGQWKEYLQVTFNEYRSGKRNMPKMMAQRMEGLSDAEVEALTHFYASQQ
ncbi:MAG: c-type cytochrome [Sterolibacterium sp.]|nr:c-type cytochrome [Sterolibacterium sp.]